MTAIASTQKRQNARPGLPRAARLVYYLSVRRSYTAVFGRLSAPASSSER
jgi:hypothetical protein